MKIAIIGISGQVGALIAQEAFNREFEVFHIPVDENDHADTGIPVLGQNVFNLTLHDISGVDAIVNAFEQADPGSASQYSEIMRVLISLLENRPNIRLIAVGDAGTLYVDEQRTKTAGTSPEDQKILQYKLEAADLLKNSKISWSIFTPALRFDLSGPRTGKYELGSDVVIKNSEKESYISGKDYAIALLDELEDKQFENRRFTAVSEKDPDKAAKIIMFDDKTNDYPGASQWRSPFCYELQGKSFHLVMDDGTEGTLWFMTGETLYWAEVGSKGRSDRYDCLKSDEDTYLINLEVAGAVPRTGLTIVLDLEQSIVTAVFTYQGNNRRYPDMLENRIVFGAIKEPGKPLTRKRHGYTTELAGTRIRWRYTTLRFSIIHVYAFPQYMRIAFPGMDESSVMARELRENPYDEPTTFIKVKENLYLVSCLEQHNTERGGIGNNMLFLIDTARLHDVGRSFGLDKKLKPENYMFSAIGELVDAQDSDQEQSKYRV